MIESGALCGGGGGLWPPIPDEDTRPVLKARAEKIGGGAAYPDSPTRIMIREVKPGTRFRFRLSVRQGEVWRDVWRWDEARDFVRDWNRKGFRQLPSGVRLQSGRETR